MIVKNLRRFFKVLKLTGMIKILTAFCVCLSISALVLYIWDPNIKTIGDGFWYCFVASTTIGFGDLTPATLLGRIITVLLSIFGIITAAMIPGVVVTYYTEFLKSHQGETLSTFMEKLEHLPELSKEELTDLSEKVKKFKGKK